MVWAAISNHGFPTKRQASGPHISASLPRDAPGSQHPIEDLDTLSSGRAIIKRQQQQSSFGFDLPCCLKRREGFPKPLAAFEERFWW